MEDLEFLKELIRSLSRTLKNTKSKGKSVTQLFKVMDKVKMDKPILLKENLNLYVKMHCTKLMLTLLNLT